MVEVSIVITAYNYERYIAECIESCLSQETLIPFEVIVVDDGSTDGTLNIASKYTSPKLRVFTKPNGGIEAASNFGIVKARGKYIVRVDADDKLHRYYLDTMLSKTSNEFDFVYPNYYIFNSQSEVTEQVILPAFDIGEICKRGDFLATGTLFSKKALERVGYYSEEYRNCGLENYELILKLIAGGSKGKLIEEPLFYYRRHDLNISELKRDKIVDYGRNLFIKLGLGEYSTNQYHPYKLIL
jgi:glycosyltransferase involved in cell wall biosynthesis